MKDPAGNLKKVFFRCLLLLLAIPFIQNEFKLFRVSPLKGAVTQRNSAVFTFPEYMDGKLQEEEEKYLNENFGFRNLFLRLNNQLLFIFFNKAKAKSVIIGKDNYLYEEGYINACLGRDFIGMDSIGIRMEQLKFIQDTLSTLNKDIFIIFAPGKGSFYPEYFPERYRTHVKQTNYEVHLKFAKDFDINHIDFHSYFRKNKSTSDYPLYPQYGVHWSHYGSCIAADSIIHFIEYKRNIDLPDIYWDTITVSEAKGVDLDIYEGMNLLCGLRTFKMGYPNLKYENPAGKTRPKVLVISDSYYWDMYNSGIAKSFQYDHFWYYNKEVYPESFYSPLKTNEINLADEINNHDVFIIMGTDASLPDFGWGFIDQVFRYFKGEKSDEDKSKKAFARLEFVKNLIKNDTDWMKLIQSKARERNISVDSMITSDALWYIQQEEQDQNKTAN